MDEKYYIESLQFNSQETVPINKEFDNLTDAIKEVNNICNSNDYRFEYIYLKWGNSLLLEIYGD